MARVAAVDSSVDCSWPAAPMGSEPACWPARLPVWPCEPAWVVGCQPLWGFERASVAASPPLWECVRASVAASLRPWGYAQAWAPRRRPEIGAETNAVRLPEQCFDLAHHVAEWPDPPPHRLEKTRGRVPDTAAAAYLR